MSNDLTIGPGKLRFYHHYRTTAPAGKYEIRLEQALDLEEIEGNEDKPVFTRRQVFHVQTSRFQLTPGDVHAVYPPANSEGNFQDTLPHVVLRRRGLPWAMDLFDDDTDAERKPWLALLLFHAGEAPAVKTVTLDQVAPPNEGKVKRPELELGIDAVPNKGGGSAPQANVIDVPVDTFRKIAPRSDELRWLAHVREVNTGDKELLGLEEDGWFSIVLANRLPGEGVNTAHLVSLEGWQDHLGRRPLGDFKEVRLVSLASWMFTARPARSSFRELMQKLDTGLLRAPLPATPSQSDDEGKKIVHAAVEQGYVPLSYDMRQGEHTAGWYRGPLLPVTVKRVTNRAPLASAEAGLIYNPASGMFDVSYAVAWQIGRLLALADGQFAASLSSWRQEGQRIIDSLLEREEIARRFANQKLFVELKEIVGADRPKEQEKMLRDLLTGLHDTASVRNALADYLKSALIQPGLKGEAVLRPAPDRKALLLGDLQELDAEPAGLTGSTALGGLPRAEEILQALLSK